ncbi:cation:proton antiporter subunit C [Rickettsia endosymbiont of Cardiosporidium cionae]|uniref:cation:proton antiporter subunit C n=1 Tax=Rickettsia endosymbiont of Cardiosporidium cionae TaxID=2777155 RepID=UPI00189434C4|nr:cation:proton antiporter subunit C [Rickettsia endosymbiont of Cardiosporidium cionae]KAF8818245.1 cation:proton antiporter [Rickettsia endosymbiont of Cardiosporidium cionae]
MYNLVYFLALAIFIVGLYILLTSDCYFYKMLGLSIFQNSILIFYISLGKVGGATAPIYGNSVEDVTVNANYVFSSPVPHVLMLTAIVVGFATLSVGLAFIFKINQAYGSISESVINKAISDDGCDY